ncbi:MAG: DUF1007 family protein [Rhodospirillaceae bacterium]|jgi:ABC-type uncharacterized transport system substrate-binding protein|nr:DUF1007 family protein [Rhodospirillaceae bacterium]MBT5240125.1 DUF1007 family protein [Rhodospirillaceae bacterium]MBT5566904.1 DUF1007 family protein [Rhodospirillaceae bacterium]MBT6090409.1 DUF1007 family protein [Rhodospirillaceae bacterium]MBT6960616.1 DUF1007 family protein [Rhodospirillaceae bacterium]
MQTLTIFLAALIGLGAAPVAAHPHVWVTGEASFQFEEAKLARIGMTWQFDAFFSQVLGADFDTNGDGAFDAKETQAMKDQVFTSLKDFGYFTHLRTEGSDVERQFESVENFSLRTDAGELVFSFDLVLAESIDPISETIGLSLFDPTIYVDLILDGEKPTTISGADGLECSIEYRQGNEVANQSYFFVPQEAWLNCSSTG